MEQRTINLMYQGRVDGTVEAFEINGHLCIPGEDGVTYVRWQDVVEFFPQARNLGAGADPTPAYNELLEQLERVKAIPQWDDVPLDLHQGLDRLFTLIQSCANQPGNTQSGSGFDIERLRKDMTYWVDNLNYDFKSWWLHMPLPVPCHGATEADTVNAYIDSLMADPKKTAGNSANVDKSQLETVALAGYEAALRDLVQMGLIDPSVTKDPELKALEEEAVTLEGRSAFERYSRS